MEGRSGEKRVLIVEDDAVMRQTLAERFKSEGYAVSTAGDGAVGLALAIREQPAVVILDILMPRTDGIAALKKLRAEGQWGKDVPVIILTNLQPDSEELNEAIASTDPAFFLNKLNVTPADIVEKVRERIGQ